MRFADADWTSIDGLRQRIGEHVPISVEDSAQHFVGAFVDTFPSLVLARVFLVLPFEQLPAQEQAWARRLVADDARLTPKTPVLALIGTRGREEAWNDRTRSAGHLAIPLLDKSVVAEAPMIAKLLADLELDLVKLDDDFAAETVRMLGAHNGKFFVPDADTAVDTRGRFVIPGREFVERNAIKTVFGMGGSYFDGVLAVAVFFTSETVERPAADRFASFISTFKTVTTRLQQQKAIYSV